MTLYRGGSWTWSRDLDLEDPGSRSMFRKENFLRLMKMRKGFGAVGAHDKAKHNSQFEKEKAWGQTWAGGGRTLGGPAPCDPDEMIWTPCSPTPCLFR